MPASEVSVSQSLERVPALGWTAVDLATGNEGRACAELAACNQRDPELLCCAWASPKHNGVQGGAVHL
jgi:hypothetical protein